MKLSQPIHRLRRQAKSIARTRAIPLHAALDAVAMAEGFGRWSHLTASHPAATPAEELLRRLSPGDLVLIAGRRGEGKTLLALEAAQSVVEAGGSAHVFSLDLTREELDRHLAHLGAHQHTIALDCSDGICASSIIEGIDAAPDGTLVVVDYLQALDHDRTKPPLESQVAALKQAAELRGLVILFICQIDRAFLQSGRGRPEFADIRLPNPLDLSQFACAAFVSNGTVSFQVPVPS